MRRKKKYKRVLLKLSGEAFGKEGAFGLDIKETRHIAEEIKEAHSLGTEIVVVVGGGNFIRGHELHKAGLTRAVSDYMGMLGTVINALALQDVLEEMGMNTRLQTAIEMREVAEPYIRRKCLSHLEKNCVVILGAGLGSPLLTTDTTAAQRATEIGAEVLLKATKVDGVFSADPEKDPKAKKYDFLSYLDVLTQHLKVMDATAITSCMDNDLPIIVFNLKKRGNIVKAIRGDEKIGTLVAVTSSTRRRENIDAR
ncbi:MAG: UMP kinase [Planctomycetes bacterium]|nr:UMP kinase [Planctomycetota bacterium]